MLMYVSSWGYHRHATLHMREKKSVPPLVVRRTAVGECRMKSRRFLLISTKNSRCSGGMRRWLVPKKRLAFHRPLPVSPILWSLTLPPSLPLLSVDSGRSQTE